MPKDNPALRLHARLKEWQTTPVNEMPIRYRAPEGDWADRHLEALKWAVQVGERMHQLDRLPDGDPDASRAFLETLLLSIFTTDGFASAAQARRHIESSELNALRLLGLQWPESPRVEISALDELVELAGETRDLVSASTFLSADVRNYLLDLADHLEKAISDVAASGTADVSRLANELVGALASYFTDAPAPEQTKAGRIFTRILSIVRSGAGLAALALVEGAASGIAQGMITPG